MSKCHTLGFPRIGKTRELKQAVERYWRKEITEPQLLEIKHQLQNEHWLWHQQAGIDYIAVGDFAFYDHVLNNSLLFNVIPKRFQKILAQSRLETYFCMARGVTNDGYTTEACEMTKWFNTNYHYIVPEFYKDQKFELYPEDLLDSIKQAQAQGLHAKPVILGPLSFLYLGKTKEPFEKLNLLPDLLAAYQKLFDILATHKIEWVQIDEPVFILDLDEKWLNAYKETYQSFNHKTLKLLFTTYFDAVTDSKILTNFNVDGFHIDVVSAQGQLNEIQKNIGSEKVLSVGIVNGRNIWRNDLKQSLEILKPLQEKYGDNLWISSSCSLLHCPVDLNYEKKLDAEIKSWLAFAKQKLNEISILSQALNEGEDGVAHELKANEKAVNDRKNSKRIHNEKVSARVKALTEKDERRQNPHNIRIRAQEQALNLPLLPTTTIGSFPQTQTIRQTRKDFKLKKIDGHTYISKIQDEIRYAVQAQEALDLDVLVHGEPERNDMVEYFGELLEGFAFTENGWVQSYGSRCVKPPIIYGDVSRPKPMTIEWSTFAQSLTSKTMKGMLTGPVTILSWSFPRDDQPQSETTLQIALALRDEVVDLEKAGIKVIQIDEPAFREHLPLRRHAWEAYFKWAVRAFRISASGVSDSTQIHTHMCYSEFNDIVQAIAQLDADVITIENSRSDAELLEAFEQFDYPNQIGPGVYDIHSPRIPAEAEIEHQLAQILKVLPVEKVWVNPDCGLKTRTWEQVKPALENMVKAAKKLRQTYKTKVRVVS